MLRGFILIMHFFLDPEFNPSSGLLNPEESRHASKVLRLKQGDRITVGDGKGHLFLGEVEEFEREVLKVSVLEEEIVKRPTSCVAVAISPTKNLNRFEWFLEKATELGVSEIIPLKTERTLRDRIKEDRSRKIILSAAKQSQRHFLPQLGPITSFEDIIRRKDENKLIAHCLEDIPRTPLSASDSEADTLILIGPEGDFTPKEIDRAEKAGFEGVILGSNRLRTETAGILAVALLQLSQG